MKILAVTLTGMLALTAAKAWADAPRVIVDIAPVHSLAAQVMSGVGEPVLLMPTDASPHHYALKPSQARALSRAEMVIWVGEALTPWLERSIETLAGDAEVIELLELEALTHLSSDEGGDHEEDADHDEDHHDHGDIDPHVWLDPQNARTLLSALAEALAKADPENADRYLANADSAVDEIDALIVETDAALKPVRDAPFITFHDAYRYFEKRFSLTSAGSVTLSDAATPGARRISEVRSLLRESSAQCVFTEPQFPDRAVEAILRGTEARVATLDPMGMGLEPGPELYAVLIRRLTRSLTDCLK